MESYYVFYSSEYDEYFQYSPSFLQTENPDGVVDATGSAAGAIEDAVAPVAADLLPDATAPLSAEGDTGDAPGPMTMPLDPVDANGFKSAVVLPVDGEALPATDVLPEADALPLEIVAIDTGSPVDAAADTFFNPDPFIY